VSALLESIQALVGSGAYRITAHGHKEMVDDRIGIEVAVIGIVDAIVVEEYPNYHAGPSVLVLQRDRDGRPIHVLWGMPKNGDRRAYLVTAYRPDPLKWQDGDLLRVPKP
jgi:hypothetical protein